MTDRPTLLEHALNERCPTCSARPGRPCPGADDALHPQRLSLAMRLLDERDDAVAARTRRRGLMAGAPRLDPADRPDPAALRRIREAGASADPRYIKAHHRSR